MTFASAAAYYLPALVLAVTLYLPEASYRGKTPYRVVLPNNRYDCIEEYIRQD